MDIVIVFGATGRLGSSLCPFLSSNGFHVVTAGRSGKNEKIVDLQNLGLITQLIDIFQPSHVINLIGETNVDRCEVDPAVATKVNTLIPARISKAVRESGIKDVHLTHLSTDQVYDGQGNHCEDHVGPVNVYGLSKLAGELSMDPSQTAILRTNFFGKTAEGVKASLSDWVVDSLRAERKIEVFEDVVFNAMHTSTLCSIIRRVLVEKTVGTYNVGCRSSLSKADFVHLLAEKLQLSTKNAKVGRLEESSLRAKRPKNMSMRVQRIEEKLGIQCPDIHVEVDQLAKDYLDA